MGQRSRASGRSHRWPDEMLEERFAHLLGAVGCPLPIHEVKAFLLGTLAGGRSPSPAVLRSTLWGEGKPDFLDAGQAREFQDLLAGLRERLAIHRNGTPYRLSPVTPQRRPEDVSRYVRIRQEEIDAFHRGMELAGTEAGAMTARARGVLARLDRAVTSLDRIRFLTEGHPSLPDDIRREIFSNLREIDWIVEQCLAIVQEEQRAARRARRADLRLLPGRPAASRTGHGRAALGRADPAPIQG